MTPAIDPTLLEPIGRVTVNFEMLSSQVEFGIWHLLLYGNNDAREQRIDQIVTAELAFRRCVELFSCLYQHRYPTQTDYEKLNQLCRKLLAIEEKRNKIIHSLWGGAGELGHSTRIKTTAKQKGIKFQFQKMSRAEINAIADEIAQAATEFLEFIVNLR